MENIKFNISVLILRIIAAGLLLPHGIAKAINGIDWLIQSLGSFGYAVFLGQIFAPICLILGIIPRFSSLLMVITMFTTIFFHENIFTFNQNGGLEIEINLLYIAIFSTTMLLGSGKYSVWNKY